MLIGKYFYRPFLTLNQNYSPLLPLKLLLGVIRLRKPVYALIIRLTKFSGSVKKVLRVFSHLYIFAKSHYNPHGESGLYCKTCKKELVMEILLRNSYVVLIIDPGHYDTKI